MRCNEAKDLLSHYLDNDLDSQTKKILDEHLIGCQACSQEFQELKEMIDSLKEIPAVEPPQDFLESVRARIEKPSVLTQALRRVFVPVHIKVPLEALAITATAIIVAFLAQNTEIFRFGQPAAKAPALLKSKEVVSRITQGTPQKVIYGIPKEDKVGFERRNEISMQAERYGLVLELQKGKVRALTPQISLGYTGGGLLAGGGLLEGVIIRNGMLEFRNASPFIYEGALSGFQLKGVLPLNAFSPFKELLPLNTLRPYFSFSLTFLPERQLILKAKNLDDDALKLEGILKDLQVVNLKKQKEQDKVSFSFSVLSFQWEAVLFKLKDWQIISPSSKEEPAAERVSSQPISVKITLTTQ